MKNDWFNILSEIINIPIDENLAYELEIFFKDFVFLRNENNTIILRCLKNDKDYELKFNKNLFILKYSYDMDYKTIFIIKKLGIYNREYKTWVDDNSIISSDMTILKSLTTIKSVYNNYPLTEIIKRRTFYNYDLNTKYKRFYKDAFKQLGNDNFEFKTRVDYEKCILNNDFKSKYIVPDIIVGSEVFRNKYDTLSRTLRVIQGFNCLDDYRHDDNSCPVLLLADELALNYFKNKIQDFGEVDSNFMIKKRKIGF